MVSDKDTGIKTKTNQTIGGVTVDHQGLNSGLHAHYVYFAHMYCTQLNIRGRCWSAHIDDISL
jgi:hypothetical protein